MSSSKPTIIIRPGESEIEILPGQSLFLALAEAGISLDQACGGRGSCGQCRLLVLNQIPPPSSLDLKHLNEDEIRRGFRLACELKPVGGEVIELPDGPAAVTAKEEWPDSFPVHPWPDLGPGQLVLAVDLGTTNVVGVLLDPGSGMVRSSAAVANGQAVFGADVMTRLTYASRGGGPARTRLQSLAFNDLANLARALRIRPGEVGHLVGVMNSALETLLLGLDPDSLGRFPCEPPIQGPVHLILDRPEVLSGATLHIPRLVGGFVGSDAVAALCASLSTWPRPPFLVMDVGTNTEILLMTGKGTRACSSAAGPAFEGGSIRRGMKAAAGAIMSVEAVAGRLVTRVIGDLPAKGIAGSGLFSLLGELLRLGALDAYGVLSDRGLAPGVIREGEEGREVILSPQVAVSEGDIQQFLLAKASARAGLEVLLAEAGLGPRDLTAFYLCGAFARQIQGRDLLSLGLLPEMDAARIVNLGPAAAIGAAIMACSKTAFDQACGLADGIRHVRLSHHPLFQRIFSEQVRFG
ncbi:MAG: ASKHA domain-containing protein [Thermodesulfobacteriota bacterium]